VVGPQSFAFNVPITSDNDDILERSGAGVLRGRVSVENIQVGATTITSDGGPGVITFNGSFTVPFSALPGQYTVQGRLGPNGEHGQGIGQFTVLDESEEDP